MEGTLVVDKKPKAVWIDAGTLKWGSSKGTKDKEKFYFLRTLFEVRILGFLFWYSDSKCI